MLLGIGDACGISPIPVHSGTLLVAGGGLFVGTAVLKLVPEER